MAYHYTESGLDNVYLVNGYTVHETPYGDGVSIQNTAGLHRALGQIIVNAPNELNGAELRFLRKEMELGQRDLAGLVGTTEQTLRLWEKHRNKALPGPADRLLRALYVEYVGGDGSVRRLVERLAHLDQTKRAKVSLRETDEGWRLDDAPQAA